MPELPNTPPQHPQLTIPQSIKDKITTNMLSLHDDPSQVNMRSLVKGTITTTTPSTATKTPARSLAHEVTPATLSPPPYVTALLRRLSAAEARILELETERSTFRRRELQMTERSKSNIPINEMVSLKMELADRRAKDDWSKLQTKYIHDTIDKLLIDHRRQRRRRVDNTVDGTGDEDSRMETTLSHVRDMLTKILHSEQVNPHLVSTTKTTTTNNHALVEKSCLSRAAFSLPDFGFLRHKTANKSGDDDKALSPLTLTRPQRTPKASCGSGRSTKGPINRSYSTSQVPSRRRRDADGSGNATWGDLGGGGRMMNDNGDNIKLASDIRSQFMTFDVGQRQRLSITREDSNEEFETVRNSLTRRSGVALKHANARAVMMSVAVPT